MQVVLLRFLALLLPFAILASTGRRAVAQQAPGQAARPAPAPKFRIANLGTDGRLTRIGDGLFAFEVLEPLEGQDLNSDGDVEDRFYRIYDVPSGALTNLDVRHTITEARDILVAGRYAAFQSFEDGALYAFDADAGRIVGLGAADQLEGLGKGVVYASVRERRRDLNGDGDAQDDVLIALPVGGTPLHLGYALLSSSAVLAEGESLVLGVSEAAQGRTDLNGDGDATDVVAHVFKSLLTPPLNLGLVIPSNRPSGDEEFARGFSASSFPVLANGTLVFPVSELLQAQTDLNGDGDSLDRVLHVHDVRAGSTLNLGLSVAFFELRGERLAIAVKESEHGNIDRNGDGDATDTVLFVHSLATGVTQNVGVALPQFPRSATMGSDLVHVGVSEAGQGNTDLNGDGDVLDTVLHAFDLGTGMLVSTGLAIGNSEAARQGNMLFFVVDEGEQGGADLDGNGYGDGRVLHVLSVVTGTCKNLGLQGFALSSGTELAVAMEERYADLNGDGDMQDFVWHYSPAGRAGLTSLGLGGLTADSFGADVGFASGLLALREVEAHQGIDLNGDGDTEDLVLVLVDLDPD